jgi:hypothetical protein
MAIPTAAEVREELRRFIRAVDETAAVIRRELPSHEEAAEHLEEVGEAAHDLLETIEDASGSVDPELAQLLSDLAHNTETATNHIEHRDVQLAAAVAFGGMNHFILSRQVFNSASGLRFRP